MPKIPTREVSRECLDALFEEYHIWSRIEEETLTTEPIHERSTPSHSYPNSTSQILQHRTLDGDHIATTHRIIDNCDETIYHWDASNIYVGHECLYRK
jgi:hypothetical protein